MFPFFPIIHSYGYYIKPHKSPTRFCNFTQNKPHAIDSKANPDDNARGPL